MYQEVFRLHADLLKALSQLRRLEIINLLRSKELSVTEMQTMLALPQANLSQHSKKQQPLPLPFEVGNFTSVPEIYYLKKHVNTQ